MDAVAIIYALADEQPEQLQGTAGILRVAARAVERREHGARPMAVALRRTAEESREDAARCWVSPTAAVILQRRAEVLEQAANLLDPRPAAPSEAA